jgi:threonyl-tRNA synthetase
VEFDEDSPDTLNKRIRNAQLEQFNFILVIGQVEKSNGTVNVRTRDNQVRLDGNIRYYNNLRKKYILVKFFFNITVFHSLRSAVKSMLTN